MSEEKKEQPADDEKIGGIYEMFSTDDTTEQEGIWVDYEDAGCKFRVARAGGSNKKYIKKLENICRPHMHQIKNDMLSSVKQRKLLLAASAGTVVLAWEGVTDKLGNPIPYSTQACIKLFTDLPDLFDDLMRQAGNMNFFREEMLRLAKGNS